MIVSINILFYLKTSEALASMKLWTGNRWPPTTHTVSCTLSYSETFRETAFCLHIFC